jgi:phospholipase D1/2
MAVKEKQPTGQLPQDYKPPNAKPHKVQTGESLGSLAQQYKTSWQKLAQLNWNTAVPEEINWYLKNRVGCQTTTPDGSNWIFQSSDSPGIIYVPASPNHQPAAVPGDRSSDPAANPPEGSKRQEQADFPADATLEAADSFWVDQKIWAPVRTGNRAQFLVDGSNAMASMSVEIHKAQKFIYITDWALTPEVRLVRGGTDDENNSLLALLTAAAGRGVQIRIMLYSSTSSMDTHDKEAQVMLQAANANIRVSRHRPALSWSHHQKTMVADGKVAFIGGIDFTSGRWDTTDHPIFGSAALFPDGDFYNSCIAPGVLNDEQNRPRRTEFPRMPWHDVHLRLEGPAVHDVERNFVERWNFQRGSEQPLNLSSGEPAPGEGKQDLQIVRSASHDSVGVNATEASILDAYRRAIRHAQHFIYIESQYFTSHFGNDKVTNQVADEISERIIRAIDKKETFRVIVVLPVHAEGVLADSNTQQTIHWQYQTIIRSGANSLIGRIRAKLGTDDVSDYLGFYCLRGYGTVGNHIATEQIYVHAKMMVVDDRFAIIGSANINDRSLLGVRDSEICAIIIDNDTETSQMNGKAIIVRSFAHRLRLALWQEHLGLTSSSAIKDVVSDSVYKGIWRKTAEENTRILEQVFPNIPADRLTRLKEQNKQPAFDPNRASLLGKIKGHLTLYPLRWLENENLDNWKPTYLFTMNETREEQSDA